MKPLNEKLERLEKELQELREHIKIIEEPKSKFKVGDAIVDDDCPNFFALITKVEGSKYNGEVIDILGNFHEEFCRYFDETDRLATQKEYEDGIIKIAEAKGYKKRVQVNSILGRNGVIKSLDFFDMCLYANIGDLLIFNNYTNQWAEIIEEPQEVKPKYTIESYFDVSWIYSSDIYVGEFECKDLAQKVCDLLNKENV